jgi:HSP20 family protein
MALMRWSQPKEIERWFEEFFGEPLSPRVWRRLPMWRRLREELEEISPAVDMYDKGNEIVVKAEIPGVEKENISISLTDSTLTIKGEVKKEEETKEKDYYYAERSYGSFGRMLTLPVKVQGDKVKASFKNGILEIHIPKAAESKPKEVKVEVK